LDKQPVPEEREERCRQRGRESVLVRVRDAALILELVGAPLVAIERPAEGGLEVRGGALGLDAGGEDLALQLLGRVQLLVQGADVDPLGLLLLQDGADGCGKAGEDFPMLVYCALKRSYV
jgi:hypothetical protein